MNKIYKLLQKGVFWRCMKDIGVLQFERGSIYREVFSHVKDAVFVIFSQLKIDFTCEGCEIYSQNCKFYPDSPVDKLPKECRFKGWQEACLTNIRGKISNDICDKIAQIKKSGKGYKCAKCAVCCKLASSEFSYAELQEKANNGDKFAEMFVSVFIPYDEIEKARAFYPEYYDYAVKKFGSNNINFYYCPKCGEDNCCSDYKNRPDVCRDFPSNPLVLLPKTCAFREWQSEVEILGLTLHALIEIVEFFESKISASLGD